jgi:RHS repeat-associated protein
VNGRLRSAYFGTPSAPDSVQFLAGLVSYANNGQVSGMAIGGSGPKASVPTPVFTTATTYDSIQRPLSTSVTEAGQTVWSQTRTYDNVGNVLGLSTVVPTQGGGSMTENEAFCYDALNRLMWAGNSGTPTGGDHCMAPPTGTTLPAYSQSYSYDSLDRMTSGAAGSYTYGDANQVHAVTSVSSVPNPYAAYDAMGNMTCRNMDTTTAHTCGGSSPTGATMSYDPQGQLASWTAPSGTVGSAHYLYDNEGNRVLTNSANAGTTTDTIYFDGYTETVLSGGTTTTTKYYSLNGQRIAVRVGSGSTLDYLVSDPLGSNSIALNDTGQVIAVQHYSPYGTVDYSWGNMPTSYNDAGERLDGQTGLLYDSFRSYDPVTGRFVRSDNVQDNSKGMDPYAYVGDNPETRNDPSGHCWPLCTMILGAVIGAAISVGTTLVSDAVQHKAPSFGEIAQSAVVGAVSGAVSGLAGPEAGPVAKMAIGALASGAGQMASNAMSGKPLMDGVGQAALIGGVTGGIMEGAGALLKGGASELGEAADSAVSDAEGAGGACGLSFRADTPVATSQGEQAIGTLEVGEKVWAYNPQAKKMELEPIQHIWLNHDNDLVDLTLTAAVKGSGGKTTQKSEVIHTNERHPFLTKEKGFIPVSQLKPGVHVMQADGSYGVVAKLVVVPGAMWMYNLTVAQDHTYAVGTDQWVVHNDSDCIKTPGDSGRVGERGTNFVHPDAQSAYDYAMKQIGGPLSDDATPTFARGLGGDDSVAGLQNGYQEGSGSNLRYWRLDYDPDKGLHFNWGVGKRTDDFYGAARFPGSYDTYQNMILGLAEGGIRLMLDHWSSE